MHAPLRRSALFVALLTASAAAFAQDHASNHLEAKELDRVLVRATPIATTAEDLTRPVDVLAGERLDAAKAATIGETVSRVPGVQSTFFGPGVGRPVIRGFEGPRVQVLNDGLASGDVSTVSVDHAVSIEPFLADQIEVLKGPATLLYGSGAIGGAVNVVDGRVPEAATEQPLEGRAELRAATVNDERTGMVRLDGTSASGHLVFHVDALHRETGDYKIPGFAESMTAHEESEEGEEEHEEEAGAFGVLPNSALRTDSAAIGVSWVGDRGFVGVGASLFNTRYGVPGHAHEAHDEEEPEEEEAHGEAPVRVVLDQRRHEIRAGLDDLGAFESLRVKLARTEYTHTEFEGEDVGTVFDNVSTELRAELAHRALGGWAGAVGLQGSHRDFEAIGEEAFVPASTARDLGVFWLGRRDFGRVGVEFGLRRDRNRVEVDEAQAIGGDRAFSTTSLSAAARWNASPGLHFSLGLDRAQRAPSAEELYSDGFHVATGSIEVGLPTLDVETANRAELGLHWHAGPVTVQASLFHARFDDFVYLADTGVDVDELPVRAWTQADARFTGAEAEIDWLFLETEAGLWSLRMFGDVVRGRLADDGVRVRTIDVPLEDGSRELVDATFALGGPLPRIVPARAGAELRWESGAWRASLGAVRTLEQDDVAANETATPGYTLVDAHLAWHRDTIAGNAWEIFLDGRNLLDEDARVHTSPLKDLAPLPGRGVSFGVRVYF
ncbi:TonB-dependent receptor [Cognatilysobacter bugurensis]|uniref:Ligand-gated channel n=1 Tax=Cognatilysobacter bugurensis TaxID=543356 RepID=A0A918W3D1_9GAMM|nr:TonB-dependent receptor [Lysobacter bugurensis]GHA68341.1 ligand-gated channel [Lysobacter bugurensis]